MQNDTSPSKRRLLHVIKENLIAALSIGALGILVFIAGGAMALRGDAPAYRLLRDTAILTTLLKPESEWGPYGTLWRPVVTPISESDPVISRYDPDRAFQGLTLVLRSDGAMAQLINMNGDIVHSWTIPDSIDWKKYRDAGGGDEKPTITPRRALLFANGDIILDVESPDVTPYGMGLVKLDKDSRIIWTLEEQLHHDLALQPNGEIYALGHEISSKMYAGLPRLFPPYISDFVAVISDTGVVTKKIYILDALYNSTHAPALWQMPFSSLSGDFMHTNTISLIDKEQASKLPFAKEGQLLISMREMNMIAVLDPVTEKIVWTMTGMWSRQHEPEILSNGNMLIFDNRGRMGQQQGSRVIEFNPVTQQIDWLYEGQPDDPLFSLGYGAAQRLPNGNTLIVESENGRILEVTRDKQIVWQYRTPGRRHKDGVDYVAVVPSAWRFTADELPFLSAGVAPDAAGKSN